MWRCDIIAHGIKVAHGIVARKCRASSRKRGRNPGHRIKEARTSGGPQSQPSFLLAKLGTSIPCAYELAYRSLAGAFGERYERPPTR